MRFIHIALVFFCITRISVHAQSAGGTTTGATSFCGNINAGFVSLSGHTGGIVCWQTSGDSGATWTSVFDSTSTFSYVNLTQTTWFRAIVQDGSFPPDTSTISVITVLPAAIAGTLSGSGSYCQNSGSGALTLTGSQGTSMQWEYSLNNGNTWLSLSNPSATYTYSSITQSTLFRVIVSYLPTCPTDTSNAASIHIDSPAAAGIVGVSDTICKSSNHDTLRLTGYYGNTLSWQYTTDNGSNWSNLGNTDSIFVYNNIGRTTWYRVQVSNGACPVVTTAPAKLTILYLDTARAGEDQTIVQYKSAQLSGSGDGTPQWLPATGLADPTSMTTIAEPVTTTTYTLFVTDVYGCVSKDSVTIHVVIQIPTAISPNNDGINDVFVVDRVTEYPSCRLEVFNRWGMNVYSAAPYDNKWNGVTSGGKDLPDDIYYYYFDYGTAAKETASGYILIKR